MATNSIISKHELWNLSNEQIAELAKGQFINIVFNNGEYSDVYFKNLLVAANSSLLFVGSLSEDNHKIKLQDIDCVESK